MQIRVTPYAITKTRTQQAWQVQDG